MFHFLGFEKSITFSEPLNDIFRHNDVATVEHKVILMAHMSAYLAIYLLFQLLELLNSFDVMVFHLDV